MLMRTSWFLLDHHRGMSLSAVEGGTTADSGESRTRGSLNPTVRVRAMAPTSAASSSATKTTPRTTRRATVRSRGQLLHDLRHPFEVWRKDFGCGFRCSGDGIADVSWVIDTCAVIVRTEVINGALDAGLTVASGN